MATSHLNRATRRKLQKVSPDARLLYAWLLEHCDEDGRMPDDPAWIAAQIQAERG